MKCGTCGSNRAEYFTWLGVTSVRCPDCGADVMPETNDRLLSGYSEQNFSEEEYYRSLEQAEGEK